MFTLDQIKKAQERVKSGADFPAYVQDLKAIGVVKYKTSVENGETIFESSDDETLSSGSKYENLQIAVFAKLDQFKSDLKSHQQGNTSYPQFCADCASSGIAYWIVSIADMTCSYFDKHDDVILVEKVPD